MFERRHTYEAKHSCFICCGANAGELRRAAGAGHYNEDNYNRGRYYRAHDDYAAGGSYASSAGGQSGTKNRVSRSELCLDIGILALDGI